MAGHSKWANIQHRKGAQDAKRSKIFTKLIREINVAARIAGSDVSSNPRLRIAIDKALGANMTKDTIERAVKKGAGEVDGASYEENRYEGYGINGVAILVDTMTDNGNRTVSDVKHAFSKFGGNMGTVGSVSYLFSKNGFLNYSAETDEDALMEAALEAGAEDIIVDDDGSIEVVATEEHFVDVKEALAAAGFPAEHSEITMRASIEVDLDTEQGQKLIKLLDHMEELDDVQNVYHNANIPAESYD